MWLEHNYPHQFLWTYLSITPPLIYNFWKNLLAGPGWMACETDLVTPWNHLLQSRGMGWGRSFIPPIAVQMGVSCTGQWSEGVCVNAITGHWWREQLVHHAPYNLLLEQNRHTLPMKAANKEEGGGQDCIACFLMHASCLSRTVNT